ncbi:MAG: ABC transporter ATP-binding protein [Bacillota bacterium]|nr:ABC transporter ATP-binding protein [Bacillota bacterium]
MKLIIRYLKPFLAMLTVSLILLFGQAFSDLSLPRLMGDIVNIGIQQKGVEAGAPTAMSQNGFSLINLFVRDADKQLFENSYKLITPNSSEAERYIDDYPVLQNTAIYVLVETDKSTLADLETIYGKTAFAMMTYFQSMQTGVTGEEISNGTENTPADFDISVFYEYLPKLQSMPREDFEKAIQVAGASDSLLQSQVGTTFTTMFYTELGVDMSAIQQVYIINKGILMLLIALFGGLCAIFVGFIAARVASAATQKMRRDVFYKVENFSNKEFDTFSTASLITRTTNDIQQVQQFIAIGIRMMCYAPIIGIGGTIFAVGRSPSLSWTIGAAVVFIIGLVIILFAVALPKFNILQKLIDKLNLVSRENLSGLMVVRSFANERHEERRFDSANKELADTNMFTQRIMAFMMQALTLIMNGVSLLIIWVGANAIAQSTLQIGDMMAFMQYAMQIIMAFLMLAIMFVMLPRAMVSANRINEVLNTEPSLEDKLNTKRFINVRGQIRFNNVSFRYSNAEKDVLSNINFTAQPGQTTAIIGSTGSGKSTLITLIPRFYDVTDGAIEIDGIDIRDVSQNELREYIGYVPQKGVLFSGDIESNIRYGKEEATNSEISKVIEVAQAKDFVDQAEKGLTTPIAQGGTNISGGQKQRLSIARALAKNPPIYIFDDSFSALDFKTDATLRKALKEYTSNAAVLIVAQRVSTIMNAEQIIVLDHGRIVGIGTHKELLTNCEVYREIAESQFSKEELA